MDWTRRNLMTSAGALGGLGLFGVQAGWARPMSPGARRFLFIYCFGGADQTTVYMPTMDHTSIPDEPGATAASVGDLRYVDHEERPSVRDFMETYGDQTAFLHGIEVRSISHERCQQLVLTGTADAQADDWPTLLAGHAGVEVPMPGLVHSGPAFSSRYSQSVIRLGETGQLNQLIDGTALSERSHPPVVPPPADVSALVDAHLARRATDLSTGGGGIERFSSNYLEALERLDSLKSLSGEVDLSVDPEMDMTMQVQPLLDCLELGLTRTAVIEFKGVNQEGFDTHAENSRQSGHFEYLFSSLQQVVGELETRPGTAGGSLLDETVVVVFSEMGRHPLLNVDQGKDHWTVTSAMLIGSGVAGGRSYGSYGENFTGAPIVPSTGEVHDSGVNMVASHLGATLLALGDVDPGTFLPGIEPITALLSD